MSKRLSWLLRHGAVQQGLNVDSHGSVSVDDVLERWDFRDLTFEGLRWLTDNSDKKRFELWRDATGAWRIRAVQGWTDSVGQAVDDNVAMQEIRSMRELDQSGFVCCHGTWLECWKIIKVEGLMRMARKHIHFACHAPSVGEVISGMRTECEVLIFLDVERFLDAGGKLYRSKNNVLLTEGFGGAVPPEFFKRAVQRRPTTGQLWPERGQSGHIPGTSPSTASVRAKPQVAQRPQAPPLQAAQKTRRWDRSSSGYNADGSRSETLAEARASAAAEEIDKKAKRLLKTLAGIERTEEKQRQGQTLTSEELDKVRRKPEIESELRMLQSGSTTAGPAVVDSWDEQPVAFTPVAREAPVPDSWDELATDVTPSDEQERLVAKIEDGKETAKQPAQASARLGEIAEVSAKPDPLARAALTPDASDELTKKDTAGGKHVAATRVEQQPATNTGEDDEKTAKRLAKTLAGIERLEEKQKLGQELSQEESDKLMRKSEVERELLQLGGVASKAEVSLVPVASPAPAGTAATRGKPEAAPLKAPRVKKWKSTSGG